MAQKPYHMDAAELGIKNFRVIKNLNPKNRRRQLTADDIKKVWDYRTAGLTVDQARVKIKLWQTKSYHYRPSPVAKQRILVMQQYATHRRNIYNADLAMLMALPDKKPTWYTHTVKWICDGQTIITKCVQDVTWSQKRSYRYPESSTISYVSYLLRTDTPSTIDFYNMSSALDLATIKKTSHALRGNWRKLVAEEFGINFDYTPPPIIKYKKIAVIDGVMRSIYDGSEYHFGKPRTEKVQPNHNGGFYCYDNIDDAKNKNTFPAESKYPNPLTHTVIAVSVAGKNLDYEGKLAYEEMTPIYSVY